MRFVILGLNYLPESTSIGPYTADLAEYLESSGHQVKVVTGFPLAPQWKIWEGYRGKLFMREIINKVPIIRTYLYVPKSPRKTLNRILFDMSFTISSSLGLLFSGPCDLIVVISPPLQLGITGWILKSIKKAPFFFHIKDLVPDAAIATGMLSENSKSVKFARALERYVYKRSAGIGVICDGFARNLINKGVPADKITVIPDYIDLAFMQPFEKNNTFRKQQGLKDSDFVVMYSGSIALKQGLQTFVEAASELVNYPDIKIFLVGEGPFLPDLLNLSKDLSLTNLHFLPLQPREGLPEQLAAADLLAITQKRAVTDIVFPGKLLYYMASGRPILAAVSADSETGRFIAEHNVGVVVPPEEPKVLAATILKLYQEGTGEMGSNGRKVAEEMFDRQSVLKKFTSHLAGLAGKNSSFFL